MSKRGYISRYFIIINTIKSKPYCTFNDLQEHLNKTFNILYDKDTFLEIGFSKRTLQRDIREIKNLFGISIEYSTQGKGYIISDNFSIDDMNFVSMMEAFDVFNSLSLAQDIKPFLHLENRKPKGTENLYGIIHAIKNKLQIEFSYQKFWEEEISQRKIEPYALKEFKNRWYILAKDNKDNYIKSFALDRLSNFEITKITFKKPTTFNIEEMYKYCFGIISPTDDEPQEIILSFNPLQGKYIKTLPLHETQQIIVDNKTELQVKLKLFITHDLKMELLSFSNNMKVLKPKFLATQIKKAHLNAANQYL